MHIGLYPFREVFGSKKNKAKISESEEAIYKYHVNDVYKHFSDKAYDAITLSAAFGSEKMNKIITKMSERGRMILVYMPTLC